MPLAPVPLPEAARRLPPGHWLHQALAADDSLAHAWALCAPGDLALPALDLGAALFQDLPGSPDCPAPPLLLLVAGTLRVAGAITVQEAGGPLHLCVLGDAHCTGAMLTAPATLHVGGALHAQALLWCDSTGADDFVVQGALHARVALFTGTHRPRATGPVHAAHRLNATQEDDALLCAETAAQLFVPGCIDAIAPGADGPASLIQHSAVAAALRVGQPVLRDEGAPALPVDTALCPGEALTAAHLRQLLKAALPDKSRHKAQGWFGQTDFMLCRAHVDEDGDAYHDSLFLTAWKAWDFWFSLPPAPTPRGPLMHAFTRAWARLRRQPPLPADGCMRLYRAYANGQPQSWQPLDAAPPAAVAACERAWRGVIDYWRKAEGQRRAGHPLRERLRAALAPEHIEALTQLPIFTREYDDWWGERNGWWEDDLWVGARQPCVRQGRHWGRALKLSWRNGTEAPGDDEHDAHACYQIDVDNSPTGTRAALATYAQRQSDARVPLPHHAVDHMARLLRLFTGIHERLHAAHARQQAQAAEQQRIAATVRLLRAPPFAPHLPDSAVFPPELLALSDTWQASGRDYVARVRQRIAHQEAGAPNDAPWPQDPRQHQAPTVLQLARVCSRHGDADLAARLRRRFAFAPDALGAQAQAQGRAVGPVFWREGGGIVARIGAAHEDDARWIATDGLRTQALPGLRGAGRSPSRSTFARCDGERITTHAGWEGPPIATLPLPRGDEGLPAHWGLGPHALARRCDELIPFDDGQAVLLRNPTGIYRIDGAGVRRIHPQDVDDDGPYAWAKNPTGGALHLEMLHMALSPCGQRIAVGDQDSCHLLLDAQGRVLRRMEPTSSYPHHAWFTHDGTRWMANACHLYHGRTVVADADGGPTDGSACGTPLEGHGWRVYAAATARGLAVVGDAHGYLRGLGEDGRVLWSHHVGGTLSGLDVTPDGRTIVAGSHGGYLAVLHKGAGPDPYSIGTSRYAEAWRLIFWTGEPAPIRW